MSLAVAFKNLIEYQDYGRWNDAFFRGDISLKSTKVEEIKDNLARAIVETRFSLDDLEELFIEVANRKGLSDNDALKVWNKVGRLIENSYKQSTESMDAATVASIVQDLHLDIQTNLVELIFDFRAECSKLIQRSVQYKRENTSYTTGVLGEVFAWLYARDIVGYDCIHHKLIPDSIRTFRHGMDLLGVRFVDGGQDEVHFLEAKATTTRIPTQRNEIIRWFQEGLANKVNTVIDQAKREWRGRYSDHVFKRAKRSLSRLQLDLAEISKSKTRVIGSILIDDALSPTENELLGFRKLEFPTKQLIIFKAPAMENLSLEVFELACKM